MKNPLEDFFPVEERPDGVYIKVSPEDRSKAGIRTIAVTLDNIGVINYNLGTIKKVIDKASNTFEKIGPIFEYYTEDLNSYIDIKVKPMEATFLVASKVLKDNIKITEDIIMNALKKKKVSYGIKDDVIKNFIENPEYDTDILVAEGTSAVDGTDGKIILDIDIDIEKKPKVGTDGKVDYRDISSFVSVTKGQVIAHKEPPQEGTVGYSVTGEEIQPQPGQDAEFIYGDNIIVSDDKNSLLAEKDGILYHDGNSYHIEEMLQITGDVDFNVGNVKYNGSLYVHGNVCPGFEIECDGNIHIGGEIESAKIISRNGSVTIDKGIIGKGETSVYGKNSVQINFAQEADIKTDGILIVEKSILHCNCICESLETTSNKSSIIGGHIIAYDHIEVSNVGNENNIPTKIEILSKEKSIAEKRLKEFDVLKEKIDKQLEFVMRDLKSKSKIMKSLGNTASKKQKEILKEILDKYNDLGVKSKYLDKKRNELLEIIKKPCNCSGFVRIENEIYPGVEIVMYGSARKTFNVKNVNKRFSIDNSELKVEG